MLNNYRTAITRATLPMGAALYRHGITADAITVAGTVGATASGADVLPEGPLVHRGTR